MIVLWLLVAVLSAAYLFSGHELLFPAVAAMFAVAHWKDKPHMGGAAIALAMVSGSLLFILRMGGQNLAELAFAFILGGLASAMAGHIKNSETDDIS